MKISRLLVLSALWLIGLGANAAVELVERTAPEAPEFPAEAPLVIDEELLATIDKTPVEFKVGDYYVAYNVGAEKYYTQGNNWGTRASIDDLPLVIRFSLPSGKSLSDGALLLNNYDIKANAWKLAWFSNAMDHMYVDRNNQADMYWQVLPQGDKVYRLQASALNPEANPAAAEKKGTFDGLFVGYDPSVNQDLYNNSSINLNALPLTAFTDKNVDWVFYAVPGYEEYSKQMEAYDNAVAVFELSKTLAALITDADSQGIDVTAAVAVYNNLDATLDQVNAAIKNLQEALANNISAGTADNPTNATSLITNPNFDNESAAGWLGTVPGLNGDGNHGAANVAEVYNNTFDTYQNLTGMPAGVYALTLSSAFRGTFDDYLAGTNKQYYPYAYAVVEGDTLTTLFNNIWSPMNTESFVDIYGNTTAFGTPNAEGSVMYKDVTYYIPNNPSTFRLYCEEEGKDYYKTTLFFEVLGSEATIGVKKDAKQGGTDWAIFDTFGLKYYGTQPAAFTVWVKEMAAKVAIPEGTVYSQPYLDAYNNAAAATATNKAEAVAAIAAIDAAAADLETNISLWKDYKAMLDEATAAISNTAYDKEYRYDLEDWMGDNGEMNKPKLRNNFTNEQIQAAIEEGKRLIGEVYKHPTSEVDVTNLLVNPDFEQGETGWTGWRIGRNVKYGDTDMPKTGGNSANHCAEAFSTRDFDLYQVVEDAPVGVYEIEVQGFCRNGRGQTAWNNYQNQTFYSQPGNFPVYVYLNAKQTPFVSVFSEIKEDGYTSGYVTFEDNQYPDDMSSAAEAFSAGMYKQTAYGLVARAGDPIRIGVKGHSAGLDGEDDNWVIFDNFKLTFKGFDAEVIKPVLQDEITKDEALMSQNMGKTAHANLDAAIKAAKASLTGEDGEAMFNCLSNLFEVNAEVTASIENFVKLNNALNTLMQEMGIAEGMGDPTAIAEASLLYTDISTRMGNHEIEDSEIEGLIDEINAAITKMKIPNTGEASDLNPVEMTSVITNPSYSESVNGWNGTAPDQWGGTDSPSAQHYNTNYDMYQTFLGLPAGTYQVKLKGFYRAGTSESDYQKKDSTEYSHAFLYAQTKDEEGNDVTSSKALMRLNEVLFMEGYEYIDQDAVAADFAAANTDTIKVDGEPDTYKFDLVPFRMSTAYQVMQAGFFDNNVVTVKVAEGAPLRIGLKKAQTIANDWTFFDEWELWYFGTESAKTPDGDLSGIKVMDLTDSIKSEYFTLDGRKATAVQKGILIEKVTFSNGAAVVRKIRR